MENIKISVCTVIGMVGGMIAKLLGGWSDDLVTLIIFMAIDFITGLIVAGIFKKSGKTESGALESHIGFKGLCKKCTMLMFVLIAHRLDLAIGTAYVRTATIIGFMVNEVISITENAGLMGIPLPSVIVKAIEVLRKKGDEE